MPHERDEIAARVRAVLARTLNVDAERVVPSAELEHDLGMDSLKTIEMNVALEEELGIVSPEVARPDELGIRTVDHLVDHVACLLRDGGR